ncbi:MAG: hypothetical protein AAB484_01405 [Patescibacteria group bacterium]
MKTKIRDFAYTLVIATLLSLLLHTVTFSSFQWRTVLLGVVGFTLSICVVTRWISFRKERARQEASDKLQRELASLDEADRRATRDYLCGRGQFPGWRG